MGDDPDASASVLAWSWVIEALANSPDVDLGTLHDLIRGTPVLSDILGKEARGSVYFRCLEGLCNTSKVLNSGGVSSSSGQEEEVRCDCSESDCFRCVLQRVVDKAAVSSLRKCGSNPSTNLRKGASGDLMRELHVLMEQRKGSLPKCALEKLRDRLQDGENINEKRLKRDRRCLQTQKCTQDCPVDVESDKSPPLKKLRDDSSGSISSTECNLDPLISSNTNQRNALPGKLAQSMRLLTWQPADVSSEDKKRHAECSSSHADSTELDVCIKCNEGGEVLICSVSSCPIVVHEKCLGFSESIDNRDNFFCPFCDCSSAQSQYTEAKRKWLLSREKLNSFVSGNPSYHHPEGFTNINANPPCEGKDGVLFKEKGFYSVDHASTDEQHKGQSGQGNTHSSPPKCYSEEEGEDITAEQCQPDKGNRVMPIEHFHYDGRGGFVEVRPLRQISSRSKNISFAPSGCSNGTLETKNHTAAPSSNLLKLQSLPKLSDHIKCAPTYNYFPRGKGRTRVPWAVEEVEKLKEGMERFGSRDMKNIPWKTILEFGSSVFFKCRTTVDLKDKWRNLNRATHKTK